MSTNLQEIIIITIIKHQTYIIRIITNYYYLFIYLIKMQSDQCSSKPNMQDDLSNDGEVLGAKNDNVSNTGYDPSIVITPLNYELLCGLCFLIMYDPVQCVNGDVYCRHCFIKCFKTNRICPQCQVAINPQTLSRNLFVKKMIDQLIIRCPSGSTCEWTTGALSSLEMHLKSCNCVNRVISCPNGCGENIQRSQLGAHHDVCGYAQIDCPISKAGIAHTCSNPLLRRDLQTHITDPRCTLDFMLSMFRAVNKLTQEIHAQKKRIEWI
jgi:hypothetical protein